MPRFFVNKEDIEDNDVAIRGEDAFHIIRSLRMTAGEKVIICDGCGSDYYCTITSLGKDCVRLFAKSTVNSISEPSVRVTLLAALLKGDKMDLVVKKAVELGVCKIIPVVTSRCDVKLDSTGGQRKQIRWQKIAMEAAKQSGRGIIPAVSLPISFNKALDIMKKSECCAILYENEKEMHLSDILKSRKYSDYAFMSGPEGGFCEDEIDFAIKNGISCISLGNRILRAETAPICTLSAIMYETGNL